MFLIELVVMVTMSSYSHNCEGLFLEDPDHVDDFISTLLSTSDSKILVLKQELLTEMAKRLRPLSLLPLCMMKLTRLVAQTINEESLITLKQLQEGVTIDTMVTQPVSG